MKRLTCNFPNGKFSAGYECLIPKFFNFIFKDIVTAYYYSCEKRSRFIIKGDENIHNLLKDYLMFNGLKSANILFTLKNSWEFIKEEYKPNSERVSIMFTGGKDSLHLLLKLIEQYGRENIIAIYCKNLNRSEACYEKETVKIICDKLGVKYRLIDITNSIKLNRNDHNIGLREQLILGCALPYIMSFKASKVFYGLHDGFEKLTPALFTSHKKAFAHVTKSLTSYGVNLEIRNHIDYPDVSEISILKDLIENHYDLFLMTNSCYTQKNFREMHHEKQQSKYKTIRLYNGCGVCLKCLRINAALLIYRDVEKNKVESIRLSQFIAGKFHRDYPGDNILKELVSLMDQYI